MTNRSGGQLELAISNVQAADVGSYNCKSNNKVASSSKAATLTVECKFYLKIAIQYVNVARDPWCRYMCDRISGVFPMLDLRFMHAVTSTQETLHKQISTGNSSLHVESSDVMSNFYCAAVMYKAIACHYFLRN